LSLNLKIFTKGLYVPSTYNVSRQTRHNDIQNLSPETRNTRRQSAPARSCLQTCSLNCLSIYLWLYSSLLGRGRFCSFLIFYTVGRTLWTGDQIVTRPLPTHKPRIKAQKSTPQVGFETTISVLVWAKTVHALDRAATVTGLSTALLIENDTMKTFWRGIIIPPPFLISALVADEWSASRPWGCALSNSSTLCSRQRAPALSCLRHVYSTQPLGRTE
jgi:hypothetical protein